MRDRPRPPKPAKPIEPEYVWGETPGGKPEIVWEHAARPLWAQVVPEADLVLLMGKDRMEARRASTGAVLWQQDAQDLPDELSADVRTIVLAFGANLVALDPATGATRWRKRPGGVITGLAGTPEALFVTTRGPLFAYERNSGHQLWRATSAWEPELNVYPEAGLLLSNDPETEAIRALDSARGTVGWEYSAEGQPVVAGPLLGETIAISAHGAGIAAVEIATGEVRWRLETGASFEAAGVRIGDTLFATDGTMHAVDVQTGEARWTRTLEDEDDRVFALRALDGELFAETWRGRLLAIDPADGSLKWERRLGQVHGMTGDANCLYLRVHVETPESRWSVLAIDRKDGELRWEMTARRQVPDVTRFGDLLVVELKNQVLALRPA
ncbi:MAG: hypothetical protein K0Q72_2077 [Armatimonadetes bacterium]|nr:hypothetical protein [Armatimonadota bacterium]